MKNTAYLVIIIFAIGFLFRLSIINVPLIEDEKKNVLIAKNFSVDVKNFYLPFENSYVTQPLLNLYVTKLGMSLFGETNFGIRFFHLLFGSLTLILVYFLAKDLGNRQGLLAMFLLAINQYHMHASIRAENESMLFFFATLSILVFAKAVKNNSPKLMILLGPVFALSFLTKGVSLLLVPAFFIYLFSSPARRHWFSTVELWLAVFLFFLFVSPWLLWVKQFGSSQLIFNADMYNLSNLIFRPTAINLYLIEVMSWITSSDYRLRISWEYSIIDGVSGIVLLLGTLFAMSKFKEDYHNLMLWIFFVMMVPLSFFSRPGMESGEFWWAQLSLIPAVCLTASSMVDFMGNSNKLKYIIIGLFIYLVGVADVFTRQVYNNVTYPPSRFASFVDDDYIMAKIYEEKGMLDPAIAEMERLLTISPNDVESLSYLGWLHMEKGRFDDALQYWVRAMEIEPDIMMKTNKYYILAEMRTPHYQSRIKNNTKDIAAQFYLGVIYYYQNRFMEAKRKMDTVVSLDPHKIKAHYYLGLIHYKMRKYRDAVDIFEYIITVWPNFGRAYYYVGLNYLASYDSLSAISFFKNAVKINPDDAKSYYQLGQAYKLEGKNLLAQQMFKKAKNIYHDDIKTKIFSDTVNPFK